MLVSERIGQFFVESDGGRDRLEYTEYGSGDEWVVLLHGLLMPRRMQQPLARAMAAQGLHVVTLDLLGHGRSDQPADPLVYSMTSFGEQVVALLDHLGAEQAVIGGTSLGANVSLEVAVIAPERVRGLIVEMPVLNNALVAGIIAFVPIMFAARYLPFTANTLRGCPGRCRAGIVPFWVGIGLDTVDHRADSVAVGPARRHLRPPRAVVEPAARDPRARSSSSATRSTRSTPSSTPTCSPPSCPTSGSAAPARILEWRFRPDRLNAAGRRLRPRVLARRGHDHPRAETLTSNRPRQGAWGTMGGCPSTATRRSCCAPTSWVRPTASSPC